MMAFRISVLLQLSSCTYVYNYFSENARIKFIPIDADVSGAVMAYFCFIFQFPNLICYGLVDWLIRYPMTAVVTVVFTSCPTRGGQQRNQFSKKSYSIASCFLSTVRRFLSMSPTTSRYFYILVHLAAEFSTALPRPDIYSLSRTLHLTNKHLSENSV